MHADLHCSPKTQADTDNQQLHAKIEETSGKAEAIEENVCLWVRDGDFAVGESVWMCNPDKCCNLHPHKGVG